MVVMVTCGKLNLVRLMSPLLGDASSEIDKTGIVVIEYQSLISARETADEIDL